MSEVSRSQEQAQWSATNSKLRDTVNRPAWLTGVESSNLSSVGSVQEQALRMELADPEALRLNQEANRGRGFARSMLEKFFGRRKQESGTSPKEQFDQVKIRRVIENSPVFHEMVSGNIDVADLMTKYDVPLLSLEDRQKIPAEFQSQLTKITQEAVSKRIDTLMQTFTQKMRDEITDARTRKDLFQAIGTGDLTGTLDNFRLIESKLRADQDLRRVKNVPDSFVANQAIALEKQFRDKLRSFQS